MLGFIYLELSLLTMAFCYLHFMRTLNSGGVKKPPKVTTVKYNVCLEFISQKSLYWFILIFQVVA